MKKLKSLLYITPEMEKIKRNVAFFVFFVKKYNGVRAYVLCLCEYIHITLKIGLHMRK